MVLVEQKADEANTTNPAVSKSHDAHSIYAPYTEEAVKARLMDIQMIVENGHMYLPAEVKDPISMDGINILIC